MSNDFSEFLKLIQPKLSFEESIHPPDPDYSDKYNWAATPGIDGQQFYVPDSGYEIKKNNDVDVFYIHPTGFMKHLGILIWIRLNQHMKEQKLCLVTKPLPLMEVVIYMHQNIGKLHISHFLIKKIMVKKL